MWEILVNMCVKVFFTIFSLFSCHLETIFHLELLLLKCVVFGHMNPITYYRFLDKLSNTLGESKHVDHLG